MEDYIEMIEGTKFYRGWNEIKVKGVLPERRSFHVGCTDGQNLLIFGGEDINEGSLNTTWKLDLDDVIACCNDPNVGCKEEWKQLKCNGKIPSLLSHHSAFIR
jgi:hypothetical protein